MTLRRAIPVVPTLIVVLAALLMVRLGVWQLHRRHEKEALLARFAANQARPPLPFVALWPVKESDLFRRTSVTCIGASDWRAEAGRSAAGASGWRHIALCRTGAEGPGVLVDVGISQGSAAPAWRGGRVAGRLTWLDAGTPLVARLVAPPAPPLPLIVSEMPAPGLAPTAQPDPAGVPNNHLAYAVQWFVFAGVALVIYGILLVRRRQR